MMGLPVIQCRNGPQTFLQEKKQLKPHLHFTCITADRAMTPSGRNVHCQQWTRHQDSSAPKWFFILPTHKVGGFLDTQTSWADSSFFSQLPSITFHTWTRAPAPGDKFSEKPSHQLWWGRRKSWLIDCTGALGQALRVPEGREMEF